MTMRNCRERFRIFLLNIYVRKPATTVLFYNRDNVQYVNPFFMSYLKNFSIFLIHELNPREGVEEHNVVNNDFFPGG